MKRKFNLEDCPKNEDGHWMAKTKTGADVVLFTNKAEGLQPLIGQISGPDNGLFRWSADGVYSWEGVPTMLDLVGPAKTMHIRGFVNVYEDPKLRDCTVYFSKSEAEENVFHGVTRFAVAFIDIEVEEGSGL